MSDSPSFADLIRGLEADDPEAKRLFYERYEPVIRRIVSGWATDFDARCASALGFKAETTFDEIIRIHIEDELGGKI